MKKSFILLCITFILSTTKLLATQYAVVASPSLEDIPLAKIKALFLKKTFYVKDTKVVVLNLPPKNPIRSSFEKKVLHMSFNKLKSYWTKQHYLGHRPPIVLKSQESIKAFIKKVHGAIGYIELSQVDDDLKILYKWSD